MGKGLGAGLVSGGCVGAVVLAMLSLYAPLPQDRIDAAPKLETETPASETVAPEDPQQDDAAVAPDVDASPAVEPESQAQAIAPATDTQAVVAADQAETATQADSAAATPVADTETTISPRSDVAEAPVVTPEATRPATAETVTPEADAPRAEAVAALLAGTQTPASVTPEPVTSQPVAPQTGGDTLTGTDDAPTSAATTAQVETAAVASQTPTLERSDTATVQPSAAPSETVVGREQVAEAPAPDTPTRPALPTIGSEDVATVSADTPITAPVPQITNPVAGVVTNRLPTLGAPAATTPTVEEAAPVETEAVENDALRQHAVPVEGAEGKSLFSVLLIDSGEDGIARSELTRLAVPVTVAIDPTAPDAAQIMAEYRAAGVEVVAIANDLPVASEPSDVAVSVSAYFDVLDEVVGLMDPLDGRIQGNRSLLQPVLGAIRDTGHGLITYDRGLNTAQQAARRENIPAATVFRILDGELESTPKIKRYLDRAAFSANQDGSVVVVGRSYAETVKAVVEWALEKKDASIAMVPISAVMIAGQES